MEKRNYRIVFLRMALSILMVTLIFRLFYIQVIKGDFYSQKRWNKKLEVLRFLKKEEKFTTEI